MVKPPSSAKTRLGLWMPSFSLNQPTVLSAAPVMASLTWARPLVMPVTMPCMSMVPNSLNLPGISTPK